MSIFRSRLARRNLCCEQVMPVAVAPLNLLGRPAPKPMYPLPLPFEVKEEEPNIPPAVITMYIEEYPPKQYPVTPGTILSNKTGYMPPGYLLCDGSAVSRTTYETLFSIIGTYYGEGDGSTTFHLPLLQNTADSFAQYIIKYSFETGP